MFEDSLVESSGTLSKRNPWTAAIAFAMQGLLAGGLVLLPLIYTEALPGRQQGSIFTEPPPPPGPAPVSNRARGVRSRPWPRIKCCGSRTGYRLTLRLCTISLPMQTQAERPIGSGSSEELELARQTASSAAL